MANGTNRNIEQDLEKIAGFAKETEKLLKMFRRSSVLDKNTKEHQAKLEKLLSSTNKILEGTADEVEIKNFDDLIADTQMSLKILKESKKDDVKFQKEFVKTFGAQEGAGSLAKQISKNMAASMSGVVKSVEAVGGKTIGELKDVGLDFLTGPFGKIASETIDFGGVKDLFTSFGESRRQKAEEQRGRYEATDPLAGIADGGITNAPSESTVRIKKGERVISPEQNRDLTGFLSQATGSFGQEFDGPIDVVTSRASPDYFDPLIDNNIETSTDLMVQEKKQHAELTEQFSLLNQALGESLSKMMGANFFQAIELNRKKWKRHPILKTMGMFVTGLGQFLKFSKFLLMPVTSMMNIARRRKTETDKIVDSNLEVVNAIKGQEKRGIFGKISDFFLSPLGGRGREKDREGGLLQEFTKLTKFREEEKISNNIIEGEFSRLNEDSGKYRDAVIDIKNNVRRMEEHLEDLVEGKGGDSSSGGFGSLAGIGGGIASFLGLKGLFGGRGKMGNSKATPRARGIVGKTLQFGKTAIMGIARAAGPLILGFFSSPVFWATATVGLAGLIGNMFGKHVVKPIFDWVDDKFKGKLTDILGGALVSIVASLEQLPYLGGAVRAVTGGSATEAQNRIKNANAEAERLKADKLKTERERRNVEELKQNYAKEQERLKKLYSPDRMKKILEKRNEGPGIATQITDSLGKLLPSGDEATKKQRNLNARSAKEIQVIQLSAEARATEDKETQRALIATLRMLADELKNQGKNIPTYVLETLAQNDPGSANVLNKGLDN